MEMQTTYSEKLRDPRWQRKRLEIMQRDHFKCRFCADGSSTLNVHHLCYRKGADPWDYNENSLVTTCESCHEQMYAVDPGSSIVQSMVVGGASFDNLLHTCHQLWAFFEDGSAPGRWTAEQWNDFSDGIWSLVCAVGRDGLDGADIEKALHQYAQSKIR